MPTLSPTIKATPAPSTESRYASRVLAMVTMLAIAIIALPFLALITQLFSPEYDIWAHLAATVLKQYLTESLLLAIGTMVGTLTIGIVTAWLCSVCEFRGRRFLEWAMILPLAYPAYIIAYVYTGIFDYGGTMHVWLEATTGISKPLPIRSLGGAIVVMSLAFYPYVYLLTRASFIQQSSRIIEVGRTLGARPLTCFLRIAIPAARPAIIAGVAIVVMETLADYGAVKYFGVNTFSVGIFRTWFGLGSITGAAQLSVLLLAFLVILIIAEKQARRHARYYDNEPRHGFTPSYRLHGMHAAGALIACSLPLVFGFLVPTLQLLAWAKARWEVTDLAGYLTLIGNSFGLALGSSLVILTIAVIIAYARHLRTSPAMQWVVQIVSSGYAIPGGVIAIAVLIFFSKLDSWTGITLISGFSALILAYTIRFLTLGFNTVDSALEKIPPNINYAAQSLGASAVETLTKIHIPLLRGGLLTATLLVFVEIIKELPATLILRPFNFNTLAVRAFELASDERLADMALPALSIAAAGILPVVLLGKVIRTP